MQIGVAHMDHPAVHEIVPSAHCVQRFRQRMPVRAPGIAEVAAALLAALEACDVSGWPPGWAATGESAPLWAAGPDIAFPLQPTGTPGRWLAVTCLRRPGPRR
ncbi:hypothetical protein GKE82_20795 [Conexibacter sp. W3-3-2]|uniref:hypothetical protein n=1 Tax=Conexibacter sp. W3-3-2 TaxID=2675227 RepID=UPI0012B831F1|nr:hypothetical protein [Conexibacter sp. W3-3-2]MTD46660.1 hypothetical protein [Conexibacter sp. W3-3-2]